MLKKIAHALDGISNISKIVVLIGVGAGIVLLCASLLISLVQNISLSFKYLYEQMAKTSAIVFAQGVFFGLGFDFLLKVLDNRSK
ncbi:MAG: hypothetical protein IJT38_02510 [Clostridia bacterium]|nr:hypothetical protein [Clostridia bacterium]